MCARPEDEGRESAGHRVFSATLVNFQKNSCKSLRICLLIFFFFLLELLISKSVKFLGKQSLVSILEIPRPHLILLGGKITERNLVYCVSSALLHFVFHTKKKGNLRVCKSVSVQQPERAENVAKAEMRF